VIITYALEKSAEISHANFQPTHLVSCLRNAILLPMLTLFTPFLPSVQTDLNALQDSSLLPGWVVLIFVSLATLYTLIALFRPSLFSPPISWLKFLFPALTLIGLAVALYIAYVQLAQVQAICGPLEECNTVLQSRYARLLGFLPNSVLGTMSYLAILFLWVWRIRSQDWLARQAPLLIVALTFLGSLLSIYLTVLQVLILKALCIWCLSSAILITLLFLLSTPLYHESHSPSSPEDIQ